MSTSRGHIVIVPLPSQGHATPALQLAQLLDTMNFRITFVSTIHNHELMMKSQSSAAKKHSDTGIEFAAVADGLPDDYPRYRSFQDFNRATLSMGPVLEELLLTLQPVTCIIRDIRMSAVHEVGKKLGIPVVGLATPSAISKQCVFNVPAFLAAGRLPLPRPAGSATLALGPPLSKDEAAARQIPVNSILSGVVPSLVIQDLPTQILVNTDDYFFKIHHEIQNPLIPDCECILFNSFQELEGEVLDVLNLNSRVFAVGPLVLNSGGPTIALREEDPVALAWLETRHPKSVVFVSFGSIATVSTLQMQALAYGLEMSMASFLWVIRTDTIVDEEKEEFEAWFPDFVLRVKDRGLLVPWAPQTAVLTHPSVAVFLTHCGWNSTIESIAYGVPMLAWPKFGDQTTNSHYITHVWKVGIELGDERGAMLPKEEIDRMVRKMMAIEGSDPEVDAIRSNARKLELAARNAVAEGGSSHVAMAKFLEFVESRQHLSSPS